MPPRLQPAAAPETRDALRTTLEGVEWRDSGAGADQMTVRGHALTWDTPYDMWFFTESVARGALDDVLATSPDVHLLWDHDYSRALARTTAKNLELRADPHGLHFWARVVETSYSKDLRALMEAHVVDQASWAFIVEEDEWVERSDGSVHRTIKKVGDLFDVTITARGANPGTDASLARSLVESARTQGRLPDQGPRPVAPADPAGGTPSRQEAGGDTQSQRRLAALRARARLAVVTYDLTR